MTLGVGLSFAVVDSAPGSTKLVEMGDKTLLGSGLNVVLVA